MAWSLLNPIDTMVARCSSGILSVGVVPGPELEPGITKGAEKSVENHKGRKVMANLHWRVLDVLSFHSSYLMYVFIYQGHPCVPSPNS